MADYVAATHKLPKGFRGRHRRPGYRTRMAGLRPSVRQAYLAVAVVAVSAPASVLLFGGRSPEPRQSPPTVQTDSDRTYWASRANDRDDESAGDAETDLPAPTTTAAPSTEALAPALAPAPKTPPRIVRRWVVPAPGHVGSGFRTNSRPGHDGVDVVATRGTAIRAVSSGVVVRVRCNAVSVATGQDWGCNRDGDPTAVRGCGWYVDIVHSMGIVTRYCHMLRQPLVRLGQAVSAGQILGHVGSSGHSTGPHLHFEVHKGNPATSANAIDPIRFMASRGASLGQSS